MQLKDTLLHAVTDYDRKQSVKRDYNVYALPQYMGRVYDIMEDIDAGANAFDAINAGFHGPLLRHVIKIVAKKHPELPPATKEKNESAWTYKPVCRA